MPLHGSIQKPDRRIADHGASTPNVSQENAIFPGSLCPSYGQISRLHGDRYDTKHADILRLRAFIFPGEEQKAYVES